MPEKVPHRVVADDSRLTIRPARRCWRSQFQPAQGTAGRCWYPPEAARGNRPVVETSKATASASRLEARNASRRVGSVSDSASIALRRAAAVFAVAIAGARSAKNSRSWSFTFSHGGLPITASNPPVHPVVSSSLGSRLARPNTAGKARCQWKKWCCRESPRTILRVGGLGCARVSAIVANVHP